jgi:A/G-specific adenine glycosylase
VTREEGTFAAAIVAWQRDAGRNDLPWQGTRDAYRVWLAEIMLQQTQVATVIPYYERFLARFPDVATLAAADVDEVMRLWSGLGYYSRARNLHRAAQVVVAEHGGAFPRTPDAIATLPGIGRSTAAAIAAFAFGARAAILDGNVKRVLARHFAVAGYPGERAIEQSLWALAESLLPAHASIERYTQGLMDLGATLCRLRAPDCARCPVRASCRAFALARVADYPAPRPRKTLPHRTTRMLVLRDGDDVLLERRPPSGIWGGLWCFPELAADADGSVEQHALERFGVTIARTEPLAIVRHGFTHFSLDITPLVLTVARRAPRAEAPGRVWLALDAAAGAALPVPAKRILALLAREQSALF